jgi:hypothetical protein
MAKQIVVEPQVVKRPKNEEGADEVNGGPKYDKAGNLLLPVKINGKMQHMTAGQINKLKKDKKVKFEPNESGVDVNLTDKKSDPEPKPKPKKKVDATQFLEALKSIDVVEKEDKQGFIDIRTVNNKLITYIKDTAYGFSYAVRSAETSSGWMTKRVITKKELDALVEWVKKQVEQQSDIESSLTPFYRCIICSEFETTEKNEIIKHIAECH